MADALLTASGLGHRYGEGPFLFRGLDLEVRPGRVLAVLGPNGKGKTTLLTCLAGLKTPQEGAVALKQDVRLSYVPQAHRGGLAYRVADMVLMGRAGHVPLLGWPGVKDRAIADRALARVGAGHLADRAFHTLSGGERSLVLIARALAGEAQVLILDEPFAALDLANQQAVLSLLARIVAEDDVAAIVTTHQPQHALALDGEALVLDAVLGAVQGRARDILDEALLSHVFRLPVARLSVQRQGRVSEVVTPLFAIDAHAGRLA
jgi:iron complex transport system ATP-binding protein